MLNVGCCVSACKSFLGSLGRNPKKSPTEIRTLYKRKDKKIRPVDIALPDEIKPKGEVDISINPKPPIPRGSRLTPEHLAIIKIGPGFLSDNERQLFIDILYKYEGAIAFDNSEMGLLWPEIEPSIVIHTIPHEPWQQ